MKRHAQGCALSIELEYEYSYTEVARSLPEEVEGARRQILRRAFSRLTSVDQARISWEYATRETLVILVRETHHGLLAGEATPELLDVLARKAEETLHSFGSSIKESIAALVEQDGYRPAATIFDLAGLGASWLNNKDHLFVRNRPRVIRSRATLTMPRSVAAVARTVHLDRLQEMVALNLNQWRVARRASPTSRIDASVLEDGVTLLICGEGKLALEAAEALLSAPPRNLGRRRSIDGWPASGAPYAAWASIFIAGIALATAPAPVTTPALAIFGALAVAISVGFVILARRAGATLWSTLLGLGPAIIVSVFALIYGRFAVRR